MLVLSRTSMVVMSCALMSSRAAMASLTKSALSIFCFFISNSFALCSVRRTVEPVRMDIGEYRIGQQKTHRFAARQERADLRGGHRQGRLPDKGNLSPGPLQGQRVADAAGRQQVAQGFRRFAVGIRALQHQDMAVLQQLVPAMPGG